MSSIDKKRIYKYLIYSLGEIILIVVGILIALQVSTWNEVKKNRKLEIKILSSIKDDLNSNIQRFNSRIKTDSFVVDNCNKLISLLNNKNANYDESMDKLFGRLQIWESVHPKKLGYKGLESKGLDIVTNDTLQSQIIRLYDQVYLLHDDIEQIMLELNNVGTDITLNYLETGENLFSKKPNDFDKIKREAKFMNYLTYLKSSRETLLKVIKNEIQLSTIELRDDINNELDKLAEKS